LVAGFTGSSAWSQSADPAAQNFGSVSTQGYPAGLTSPPAPAPLHPKSPGAAAFTVGWNYFTCDRMWMHTNGSYYQVTTINSDGSTFTASSTGDYPNDYQAMLIRACKQSGAYYGIYIKNITTGNWIAAAGY
jgi:hypothetical protein